MLVEVAVNIKFYTGKDILHYLLPESLVDQEIVGCRVEVPLGKSVAQGYVVGLTDAPMEQGIAYKPIKGLLDDVPIIDQELISVARWVSHYYLCSCYQVLEFILPSFARSKKIKMVEAAKEEEQLEYGRGLLSNEANQLLLYLRKNGPLAVELLVKQQGAQCQALLEQLHKGCFIQYDYVFKHTGNKKTTRMVYPLIDGQQLQSSQVQDGLKRATKQKEVLEHLVNSGPATVEQLRQQWPGVHELVKGLVSKGFVETQEEEVQRMPSVPMDFTNTDNLVLNEEQERAVREINQSLDLGQDQPFLLHGVTGSGKTEVYLRAIRKAVQQGKGVIVLVPEISLTPQMIGRFKSMLGDIVEVLHSNLSDGERYDVWRSLRKGTTKVIVGVRSAVFAPVSNLGLIIVDEEHESTYKQSEPDPRYHAREVALYRGKINQATVILGSATPSVTSYHKALTGEYKLLEMLHRAKQQPLPEVEVVDLAEEFKQGNRDIFSKRLQWEMEQSLSRREQIILFLNRRGYSTFVLCRECGNAIGCKKCEISLTYHKHTNLLKCHYCDAQHEMPKACPTCGSRFIKYFGAGTQLIEEHLLKRWPGVSVDRLDLDTTRNKNSHQEILGKFRRGETQILIGTQMVTKGLDFPNVTLVGVIAADSTLNLPDYSASERTFQQITQVAGRAGRGDKRGKVVVQTYNPLHYSIIAGSQHDYHQFYQQEIKMRELMEYPPFSSLVRILVSDLDQKKAQQAIEGYGRFLVEHYPQLDVLGPAPAPIARIKERFRYQIILKHSSLDLLREATLGAVQSNLKLSRISKNLRTIIDVEPQSIL